MSSEDISSKVETTLRALIHNGEYRMVQLDILMNSLQAAFKDISPEQLMAMTHQLVRKLYESGWLTIAEAGWRWIYWEVNYEQLRQSALNNLPNFVRWNWMRSEWEWNKSPERTFSTVTLFEEDEDF